MAMRFLLEAPTGIPVVSALESPVGRLKLRDAMNTTKRLFLGVLSSLLLAIGFARAADRLDPMSSSLGVSSNANASLSTLGCTEP